MFSRSILGISFQGSLYILIFLQYLSWVCIHLFTERTDSHSLICGINLWWSSKRCYLSLLALVISSFAAFEPRISDSNRRSSFEWLANIKKDRLVLLHLLFVLNAFDYNRQLPYYLLCVIRNRVVAQNEGTRRIWVSLAALATGMRSNLAEGTSALCLLFVLCSSPKWKLTGFLWCFQSHGSKIVAKEYVSVCSIARFSLFLIL